MQTSDDAWWLRLSRPVRQLPTDVAGAIGLALVADLLVLLPDSPTPLRFVFGALLLFFLPGYATVAALFPARRREAARLGTDSRWSRRRSIREGTIGLAERAALSVATSVTVLVLVGLLLAATPWGLALEPLLAILTGLVVLGIFAAIVRRRRLPPERRFRVPLRLWFGRARDAVTGGSRSELLVNALLAVAIVAAMSSLTYALAVPGDGERYTDFYLATEDDSGELTTAGYPTEFTRDQPEPLTVAVENHEQQTTSYTVVVQIQRVETDGDDVTVLESHELDRMQTTLDDGETWTEQHEVAPTIAGEDLRLTYLLYEGEPPENPTTEDAEESAHLWVDVTQSGG